MATSLRAKYYGATNFYEEEERTGVRFSWNAWPTSRIEAPIVAGIR